MSTDYQVGDEITRYRPTPHPIDVDNGDRLPSIPPFSDKQQEREYQKWRDDLIFHIYGPQGGHKVHTPGKASRGLLAADLMPGWAYRD